MIGRFALRIVPAAMLAGALSGCALLSTPDPVQLYRFGATGEPALATGTLSGAPIPVSLRRIDFPEASKGDRILGITGTEAAYIAGARWVSPAEVLFSDSLEGAFSAQPDRVRLLGRRELGAAVRVLSLDVTTFEARYPAAGAAPDAVISVRARMVVLPERDVTNERTFTVRQPAGENRVAAIVEAFDIASRDLNTQIVEWTTGAAVP